jgi:hypothetical protein
MFFIPFIFIFQFISSVSFSRPLTLSLAVDFIVFFISVTCYSIINLNLVP